MHAQKRGGEMLGDDDNSHRRRGMSPDRRPWARRRMFRLVNGADRIVQACALLRVTRPDQLHLRPEWPRSTGSTSPSPLRVQESGTHSQNRPYRGQTIEVEIEHPPGNTWYEQRFWHHAGTQRHPKPD